jgi:hypothetical protein
LDVDLDSGKPNKIITVVHGLAGNTSRLDISIGGTPVKDPAWQLPNLCRARLQRLRKNSKTVIPRAGFARGICFFPGVGEKADPSLRSG